MPVAVDRQSRTAIAFQDTAQWTIGQHFAQATLFQTGANHWHDLTNSAQYMTCALVRFPVSPDGRYLPTN
jgi:hypothetical protein